MDTKPTRRSLLRWLGVGAAVGACGPSAEHQRAFNRALDKPAVPGADRFGTFEERWVNSSCAQCPAGCGIRVRVVEGRAVRIEGNPANPLNRGGIGPRGLAGLQALYDADRLTGPMMRDGKRLVATTWDAAIAKVTAKLAALRTAGESHRVLVISGRERGMTHELFGRFAHAYGTPNFIEDGRSTVMAQAMHEAVGTFTQPAFDWGGARYVLSLEAGLLEDSCQSVYFTRGAAELRRGRHGGRAKIVHVGATFDLCAYNADEWVQIAPGTSGAIALGIAHVLVRDGRFDRDFVHDQTERFEALVASLTAFTPAKVEAITGAPAATIERLAAEIAESSPSFAIADERSATFTNGLDTARAALALNALVGAFGRSEGGVMVEPEAPIGAWPAVVLDAAAATGVAKPRLDGAGGAAFPRSRGVHEALPDALRGPDAPEVVLLYHANPAWARAQPQRWRDALARVPLVVSFSPYLDETVDDVAHVVLPDHTYLERWEDAGAAPGTGKPVVGIRRPVVEPLHDTRPAGDVVLAIARGLGGAVADALPWPTFTAAMELRLIALFDAHRGSIQARGKRELLDQLYTQGFWFDPDAKPMPVRFKFHPGWREPTWASDPAAYPLTMIVYRPLGYAEGSGANQPWLRHLRTREGQRAFTAPATLHPDDAPGIADHDEITVTSTWGSVTLPVKLDRRMRRGAIAVPHGGGHTAFGRWAKGVGVNPMTLIAPGPAPESGANAICTTRVRIAAADHGHGGKR
jgi:anaerobic selenocysteine-containing dehydrogenase